MKKTILCLTLCLFSLPAFAADKAKESAYDRVMRTGVLRCGYIIYPLSTMKDENTGKTSGISVDIVEYIAAELSLKVDWAEEVGTGTMIEGLNTGRYDMVCTNVWANTPRARAAAFLSPLYYTAVAAYVRADDTRFDGYLERLNAPDMKIASIDGGTPEVIAKTDFPLAAVFSMPDMTDFSQNLMNVVTGKADATFSELAVAGQFLEKNPGTLKDPQPGKPVRVFSNSFAIGKGESELKDMLNIALANAHNNGVIDRIISHYETPPGSFYRVAKPYEVPQ